MTVLKYTIETHFGKDCLVFCHEIASIRIQVFKEYPYLYDGNYEYELEYLETFFSSKDSILVIAKHQDNVVGISTGLPLKDETENIQTPWLKEKHNIDDVFYFGESAIEKKHRGNGIGHLFFKYREEWARKKGYKKTAFCSVVRPENHTYKPEDHRDNDVFWKKMGYQKDNITCEIAWKEINEEEESEKQLRFWFKEF